MITTRMECLNHGGRISAQAIMNAFAYFDRNRTYWTEIRKTESGEMEYQQRFLKRVQYERRKITGGIK